MADNIYQDLKKALDQFKSFLHNNMATIKTAYQALRTLVPRIEDLVNGLIDLLGKIRTEIANLDVSHIPGLSEISTFSESAKTLLETAKTLLPDQKAAIDDVLAVTDVVSGLPSVGDVKNDILGLIDTIVTDLENLKKP
jgi:phage-related protein